MDAIKVAIALLHCEITVGRGEKLTVRVTKPPFPRCIIDDEFKESETSHNETIHTSDKINGFVKVHRDFEPVSDYFCALLWPLALEVVFNVLSEYMPDLKALNLN